MRWYLGAILLLAIALVFSLGLLAYAMYALLGVMIVSRYLTRRWAESVSAQRECNRLSANVGETVAVVVDLENRSAWPIPWTLLEDLLPREAMAPPLPRLRVIGSRLQLLMFASHARRTLYYQIRFQQRGYYQIGPLMLETGDLFGLHRRYRMLTEPHFVLVYPDIVPLEGYDLTSRRPIGEVRMAHRLFEDPTRIAGVRPYEAGDPLNRIHWRLTARTGDLHSKVYEPSTVAGATILLEFHRAAYGGEHVSYRAEVSVRAAASLANALYEMGQQVGLVTNGRDAADRIRQEGWAPDPRTRNAARRSASMIETSHRLAPVVVETQRGPEQLLRIFETLARVELADGLTFAQLVYETGSRLPRDATVVALLPSVSTETAVALGNLRRRGFAVTAIVHTYHIHDFEKAAGLLAAEKVEARHLRNNEGIATMCRDYITR
ncbi:MAG: DUF58 domain-containing protein [Thermoguttaceae bacterium]